MEPAVQNCAEDDPWFSEEGPRVLSDFGLVRRCRIWFLFSFLSLYGFLGGSCCTFGNRRTHLTENREFENLGLEEEADNVVEVGRAEMDAEPVGRSRTGAKRAGVNGNSSPVGWTKRFMVSFCGADVHMGHDFFGGVRVVDSYEERKTDPNKPSALECTIRSYVENHRPVVVDPVVGTTFDLLEEAYSYYNLYSWEVGFGIRCAKSGLNVRGKRSMQEIVCGCSG